MSERARRDLEAGVPIRNREELLPELSDHRLLIVDPATSVIVHDTVFDYLPVRYLTNDRAFAILPDDSLGFQIAILGFGTQPWSHGERHSPAVPGS